MTREEAWQGLEGYSLYIADGTELKEALKMAIEALNTSSDVIEPHNDVIDVVRCKDCRYFKKIVERSDSGLCHRDIVASAWKENGYCSRGERKGGDSE